MAAMSKNLPIPLGALEVEAKATEEGILLVKDLRLKDVIVEGDTKIVMSTISNPNSDTPPCSIQKLVEGAKSWLRTFNSGKVNHVYRNSNIAAHVLARHACNVSDSIVWVEDTPPMISDQVCMDVLSSGLTPN